MLQDVAVLVPTLRGRTSAQLYQADGDSRAPLGAVLVSMPGPWASQVERVYDELALYLRSAGIAVLRLRGSGSDATAHATEILGSVSLLQSRGAGRIVLIAGGADADAPPSVSSDAAFSGLLDLITARASSPRAYAQLISELVDTIRSAVDVVVGIGRLVPCQPHLASPPDAAALCVALPPQGEPADTVDAIAQLYTWAVPLLRSPQTAATGAEVPGGGLSGDGVREPRAGRLLDAIWGELERAWHDVMLRLEARAPERVRQIRALPACEQPRTSPASIYRQAWVYLDHQGRVDWIAACARVFPLNIA